MEFRSMKRKKLQALCKKHGVPANLTNIEMVDRLSLILKEKINEPDERAKSAGSNPVGCENKMDAKEGPHNAKKVRFSPNNETFLFVSSNVKNSVKPKRTTRSRLAKQVSVKRIDSPIRRTTRSRLAKQASVKRIDSPIRSSRSREQNLAKTFVVMDVSPLLEAKRTRQTKGHSVAEITGNNQGKSDGIVDVQDHQTHLENVVPKKRTEEPFNRSKSAKNTARNFVALPETDNSSAAHQRDCGRRPRKKLEPQKKKDEDSAALDEKPEEIKISGRVTRMRSRMILKTAQVVAPIAEAETRGEAGQVKQREEPAKAVSGNFKKPRTSRKNLRRETHVSSNCRGADSGQGKLNGMRRDEEGRNSSILILESVKPQSVELTVVPGNNAQLRRSKRKPQQSTVLAEEISPADAVDRMNSQQKQEDSLHVKVAREKLTKGFTMDIGPSYEEPSRTSGSHALNAVQLYHAEVSSETIGKKQETGSEALISKDVSSITSPSEAKSSLPDGFNHVKKLKMKNPVENSEENFDGEKSDGAEMPRKGGYANQKTQELPSNVAVVSEELSSLSEDCEKDFQAKLHNQSSPPLETAGNSCACLLSFDEGFVAEQVFLMMHDCSRGIAELDHQDDWHSNRVSERGKLTPADKVEDRNHNKEGPTCGCQATHMQVRNSAFQTEDSRIAGEDIQLKTACPLSDEALCRERDGDGLPSEKYNKIKIAEAIDKQITNQDAVQAVGPLMAVLHMDASDECLRDLSPGRDSVATKQYEVRSSWQPQESDYASNQMPTDTWNDFVGAVTNAAEAKSIDTTNRQGTPRLMASKSSYNQEALDENKEGSGTCSLDLHFHQGEIDGGSSLTPQTVPDACLNQVSVISEKMSDPSSFGISGLFDHMVRGDDAEFYGDDHLEKVAAVADAHRNSMSPTEASVDRQKHMGTKYEDDVYCSDGLSGRHCGDTLRVNDVRPYYDNETCGDYHLEEVAADANIETFSQAETSTWKKYEQVNMEEFSAHTQSSGSIIVNTGRSILHHCSNQKKLNSSGQEDMKKRKHDQFDLEADLDGIDQELLSIEASRDRIPRVQTAISGLPHSNADKSSSKAQKSVKLPEQDSHECICNTPPPSVEGSFDTDKASKILGIGEYKLRMATPEQDAILSKDELTITSPGDPKSSKAKSFTIQEDIKDITNPIGENTERSVFVKRITSSPENYAENAFQIDQKVSSPAMESEAKLLTSPATLLKDIIQRSICSGVEVAAVEDVQWLERALLDDTYDCSVKCTESSGSATTEEVHGTSVQENAEIMTIQNALIFAADSQHARNASHVMDEKTEKPSNAQTHPELELNENKGFAAEDLYPLVGGEEPNYKLTVQNLSSNTDQKIEEENVELKISEFPKNEEENEVGMEKTVGESENQLILPSVEQKSDDAKEAHEENGSHMLADEVQASDPMVESRSPHTCASRSPVLSLANSAIHNCSKFSDVQVEDPTFTSEMSPLLGDSPVLHNASNMSTDDQNVRFESENIKEESKQQINHQEAPGAEEIAETTDDSVDVSSQPNFKGAESAEEEFKDIDVAESIANKNALADDFHAENIKGPMDDQEAASAMIQEYMDREEEDETRTINSSIGCNDDVNFPYPEADYLPAGVLFSENRDFIAVDAVQGTRTEQLHVLSANSKQRDRSSKQSRMTHITETPMRTAPRASDMKENASGMEKARAPTTASKTRTLRLALEFLPNK